jgi:hypothetical protein
MGALVALVPVLLQLIEEGVTEAPALVAEVKAIFAGIDPAQPALTAAQEQAIFAALSAANTQVQGA